MQSHNSQSWEQPAARDGDIEKCTEEQGSLEQDVSLFYSSSKDLIILIIAQQ